MVLQAIPVLVSLAILPFTIAQAPAAPTILPATLPTCAQQCNLLTAAQNGCIPPNPGVPVSNQATYTDCFCHSTLIVQMQNSAANICAPSCSDTDFATIETWFQGFCAAGAAPPPTTPTPTAGVPPSTATPSTTDTSGATPTIQGDSTGSDSSNASSPSGQAWLATHTRWVIMLVVLAVGLIVIGILASWLHRRHRRRREAAENLGPRPGFETWAPAQHSVHDVTGFGAVGNAEKGKAREGVAGVGMKEVGRGKRLTKGG